MNLYLIGPHPRLVTQLADLRWRHEAGPQQALLGAPGLPPAVNLAGPGPARRLQQISCTPSPAASNR
jgi:hypothetical protein